MKKSLLLLPLLCLMATAAHAQVNFGGSAAIGGGEVFVAEPGNVIDPGVVYVYSLYDVDAGEKQRLMAGDAAAGDGFGRALAVGDGVLLVGADVAGAVYVFEKRGDSWQQTARLSVEGSAAGLGAAIALVGEIAYVGDPAREGGRGAVHVFRRGDGQWQHVTTLQGDGVEEVAAADEEQPGERPEAFGSSIAAAGEWLLVGAPAGKADLFLGAMFSRGIPTGSAYTFKMAGDTWTRVDRLRPPMNADGAIFGNAVAMQGGEALVGAEGTEDFTGAVYAYRLEDDGSQWILAGRMQAFDAGPRANFGHAVAVTGEGAIVGAPGAGGGRMEGRAYRFERGPSGEWTAAAKIDSGDLQWGSAYGAALAGAGTAMVVGVPGADYGAGAAVILRRVYDGWSRSRVITEARGLPAIVGREVPCVDGKADIFPCDNVDLVSFLPVAEMGGGRGVTTNDIWGWTDPESGRDYVIQGLRDGTAFVDVTDPLRPVFVGKLPKTAASPASLWRDVKVYDHFALIVADASGPHGVQIFDLHELRRFTGEPIAFAESVHYDGTYSTHNLAVNQESSFAYAVGNSAGGEACGGALHMIDMEDPNNPQFAGCFQPPGPGGRAVSTHDTQCVTYHGPDERYQGREICFSSNGQAFSIGDVTDKRNPVPVALATYPNLAYTHQGWLDEEQRYFYMNDEGDEAAGLVKGTRTLIWNVEDLEDPILVSEYTTDNPATDHNLYIVGDVMYQSNYRSGLRVVDISDRENPVPLGFFDTVPWGGEEGMGDLATGALGSWSNYPYFKSGVVAVASGKEGLFLVRLREPGSNRE